MKRVAVTGIGVVAPIGCGRQPFWDALLAGRSGIGPVTSFDTSRFPVHIGAQVRDFIPDAHLHRQRSDSMGRASQFAVAAAGMALADARIDLASVDRQLAGVSLGTTSGEPLLVERYNDSRKAGGGIRIQRVPPAVSLQRHSQPCRHRV